MCVPGPVNSRSVLLPLLRRFGAQVRVSLYHTPDLRGLLRLLVPQRFNETIGVQHIKVYLFDDSVIISGYVRAPCSPSAVGWRRAWKQAGPRAPGPGPGRNQNSPG